MFVSNCMCPVEIYIYSGSIHHVEDNNHPSDQYEMNVRKHSLFSIHTYLDVCILSLSLFPPPTRCCLSLSHTFSSLSPPSFFSSFSLGTTMLLTVTLWLSITDYFTTLLHRSTCTRSTTCRMVLRTTLLLYYFTTLQHRCTCTRTMTRCKDALLAVTMRLYISYHVSTLLHIYVCAHGVPRFAWYHVLLHYFTT